MRKFECFNAQGDGLSVLVEVVDSEGKIVMIGDDYHDKIGHVIEGYLMGIKEYAEVSCKEYWIDIEEEAEFDWQTARNNNN
ncbi:hypothetical protein [Lederbergia lenta]|uniref:hypothetical protein n=1 Tax=Lederbergia lenta TaxID=1467 RepID=UPI00203B8D1D|nr:hypothetical protein [Lederbergia lenta]MCM3109894.1 hypothetical protein [Lederbergia lenta]